MGGRHLRCDQSTGRDCKDIPEAMQLAKSFLADFATDETGWKPRTISPSGPKVRTGDVGMENEVRQAHGNALDNQVPVDEFLGTKQLGIGF